jgi:hypothetical protein
MRRSLLLALTITLLIAPRPALAQSASVDVVILVDTSASMIDELDSLCARLADTEKSIQASGLRARVTVIGITDKYKCAQNTVRLLIPNSTVANDENWGPAMADLIGGYAWQPSAIRLIIPVSDAGPAGGKAVDDPGPDRDVTTRAVQAAVAGKVILSPLIGSPTREVSAGDRARIETLARDMAAATGGRVFISNTLFDLPEAIPQLVTAASVTTAGLTAIAAVIRTPGKISLDSSILLTNIALAATAAVLIGLTATLSAETFGSLRRPSLPANRLTSALGAAAGRVDKVLDIIATPSAWTFGNAHVRRVATAVILAAFMALIALVASFLDPEFQPTTPRGIGTFVTILVALMVVNLATGFGGRQTARSMQVSAALRVHPGAVLIAAACVVLSRSIGFLPGYLVGLPAGLAVIAAEGERERNTAIGRGAIIAAIIVGLIAWLLSFPTEALSANLSGSLNSSAVSVALSIVGGIQSALLTIFLVAIEFALISLLPIGPLIGRGWFAQRKLTWGIVFGLVMFTALQVAFNPGRVGLDALRSPGLLPLAAIVAAYSGITLVAWLLTNESRIRNQQGLNRRSALIAGVLIVAWLGGIVCLGLAAVTSAISSTTVLIAAAIVVIVGIGVWIALRARTGRLPPSAGA